VIRFSYSPMILTNTRFHRSLRSPSRLPGQPFRLTLKDALPRAKIEPAVGHGNDRCASRPMTCEVQPVSVARFRCASATLSHRSGHQPGSGTPQASSPVRLCQYWSIGAWGASLSSHTS
jgi:hypothetical protein